MAINICSLPVTVKYHKREHRIKGYVIAEAKEKLALTEAENTMMLPDKINLAWIALYSEQDEGEGNLREIS
ncbi:MAG: hypothetical protein ACTS73_01595 [Arsenophonus sp. NEOnobi-MAG3]